MRIQLPPKPNSYDGAWHRWFAWHPVIFDRTIVWLAPVQRRWNTTRWFTGDGVYGGWEYRLTPPK